MQQRSRPQGEDLRLKIEIFGEKSINHVCLPILMILEEIKADDLYFMKHFDVPFEGYVVIKRRQQCTGNQDSLMFIFKRVFISLFKLQKMSWKSVSWKSPCQDEAALQGGHHISFYSTPINVFIPSIFLFVLEMTQELVCQSAGSLQLTMHYSNALRCNTWLPCVLINIRINSREDPRPLSDTYILHIDPSGNAHINTKQRYIKIACFCFY